MKIIEIEIPDGYEAKEPKITKDKDGLKSVIIELIKDIKEDFDNLELTEFELHQVKKMHL